jgi:hypothetical protein
MISNFNIIDILTNRLYDSTTFVTEDNGECTFRIIARKCVGVAIWISTVKRLGIESLRVTDTGAVVSSAGYGMLEKGDVLEDFNSNFTRFGWGNFNFFQA